VRGSAGVLAIPWPGLDTNFSTRRYTFIGLTFLMNINGECRLLLPAIRPEASREARPGSPTRGEVKTFGVPACAGVSRFARGRQ
jgi:hypothetical protein